MACQTSRHCCSTSSSPDPSSQYRAVRSQTSARSKVLEHLHLNIDQAFLRSLGVARELLGDNRDVRTNFAQGLEGPTKPPASLRTGGARKARGTETVVFSMANL